MPLIYQDVSKLKLKVKDHVGICKMIITYQQPFSLMMNSYIGSLRRVITIGNEDFSFTNPSSPYPNHISGYLQFRTLLAKLSNNMITTGFTMSLQ